LLKARREDIIIKEETENEETVERRAHGKTSWRKAIIAKHAGTESGRYNMLRLKMAELTVEQHRQIK